MKHCIKVISGDYAVHHVSPAYPELFMPTCSCGWEGAWVETRNTAKQDGSKHRKTDRLPPSRRQPDLLQRDVFVGEDCARKFLSVKLKRENDAIMENGNAP